jgi:hypothetical protein
MSTHSNRGQQLSAKIGIIMASVNDSQEDVDNERL